MVSPQHPKIDAKRRAVLDAIDQTRRELDQAINSGDDIAAASLLEALNELAQKFDLMDRVLDRTLDSG